MYVITDTKKSFAEAVAALEAAVPKQSFGILHVHDLGNTLRSKGLEFANECKVFEVCNPKQAKRVMDIEMRMNQALPCRISVYTEQGATKIGFISPVKLIGALSADPAMGAVAQEVEDALNKMVAEAK